MHNNHFSNVFVSIKPECDIYINQTLKKFCQNAFGMQMLFHCSESYRRAPGQAHILAQPLEHRDHPLSRPALRLLRLAPRRGHDVLLGGVDRGRQHRKHAPTGTQLRHVRRLGAHTAVVATERARGRLVAEGGRDRSHRGILTADDWCLEGEISFTKHEGRRSLCYKLGKGNFLYQINVLS